MDYYLRTVEGGIILVELSFHLLTHTLWWYDNSTQYLLDYNRPCGDTIPSSRAAASELPCRIMKIIDHSLAKFFFFRVKSKISKKCDDFFIKRVLAMKPLFLSQRQGRWRVASHHWPPHSSWYAPNPPKAITRYCQISLHIKRRLICTLTKHHYYDTTK